RIQQAPPRSDHRRASRNHDGHEGDGIDSLLVAGFQFSERKRNRHLLPTPSLNSENLKLKTSKLLPP
ncbi:MAG: hypothetical protein V4584_10535, partial [Verrucomicrobiota bacterium]